MLPRELVKQDFWVCLGECFWKRLVGFLFVCFFVCYESWGCREEGQKERERKSEAGHGAGH